MIKFILRNWKTSGAAVLAGVPQLLHLLWPIKITQEIATYISGMFVSLGLIAAKDGNVTGGITANIPNDAKVVEETSEKSVD